MSDLYPKPIKNRALNKYARQLSLQGLPVVFSLRHLSLYTEVDYKFLRATVKRNVDFYKDRKIRKKSGGYRLISVPASALLETQRWINQNILQTFEIHKCATAYKNGSGILHNAEMHVGAKWLIKLDIENFFENISERDVYSIFNSLGYSKLLSFEMARICTRVRFIEAQEFWWEENKWPILSELTEKPYTLFKNDRMGFLPQGAATSPSLSNIFFKPIDEKIKKVADRFDCTYTRYSDDMVFSTSAEFSREIAELLMREVSEILWKKKLAINKKKTRIIPPGAKKIVTGLVISETKVSLSKEYRFMLDYLIHLCLEQSFTKCYEVAKINSAYHLKNYVEGKLNFARSVDSNWTKKRDEKFKSIIWPKSLSLGLI